MITEKETVKPIKSKDQTTIEALRSRCESSPTFNSMCHVFALRERTRRQITVASLQASMIKEGFKYTKQQLAAELKFLADAGIGKLVLNKRGAVEALTNVSVTLQSIGLAAVSRADNLSSFRPVSKIEPLEGIFTASTRPLPKLLNKKSAPVAKPNDFQAYLTLIIDEKIMQFDLLPEFSTKELFNLMAKAMKGIK